MLEWIRWVGEASAQAATLATKAADTDEGVVVMAQAAAVLARSGRADLAERLLPRLDGTPDVARYRVARRRMQGEIALARDRRPEAVTHFRAAAAEEIQPYGHEYLARCLLRQGDRAAARLQYAEVTKLRKVELRLLYLSLIHI